MTSPIISCDIVQIEDTHIFLGSLAAANNVYILEKNNIKHILSFLDFSPQITCPDKFSYKLFFMHDNVCQDILSSIKEVIPLIEIAAQKNENVFIHCHMGISRSVTVVVAWLMWKNNMSFAHALQKVKKQRYFAQPNYNFSNQLAQWEQEKHSFRF